MTVKQFMLKKFPTNEYMDCPVPKHHWETIQEYANAYHESKVKSDWDLRKFFEQMRFDKNHHLGLGDIRLTITQQEEICELVERFYRCR